jgi:hypothetical protein
VTRHVERGVLLCGSGEGASAANSKQHVKHARRIIRRQRSGRNMNIQQPQRPDAGIRDLPALRRGFLSATFEWGGAPSAPPGESETYGIWRSSRIDQ